MYPESEQATRLVILGTGNAMATRCYNTCFALCPPGGDILLVDAGGGNGIFRQMERPPCRMNACATSTSRTVIPIMRSA